MVNLKNKQNKILIVEDERHIAEAIKLNLNMIGHEVVHAINGLDGLNYFKEFKPELVIVDLMMPEIDGIGVISEIRKVDLKIPILVVSAKDQVKEKVRCLSLGVDDYLPKPFDLDEFLLRVDRLLTRAEWNRNIDAESAKVEDVDNVGDTYKFGSHTIDFKNLKAYAVLNQKEEIYDLTLQESKILKFFFNHPNVVLTREDILNKALGYEKGVSTRTLDNFIVRFRKYFETDPKRPRFFKSVRSVGYIFDRQEKV